jgi:putative NIF3 family GTP cyclohydrolase 1 type 2
MKLSYLYDQVIKFGIERDPRKDKKAIKSYADTSILYGRPEKNIRKIIVGIDVETAELLLADRFRKERGLDLVISHHPQGKAYATLNEVMRLQIDLLKSIGVADRTAQELLEERMREVQRKILPANHTRPVDAAKLLDLPFMCIHTPADNHVFCFIKKIMEENKPKKVIDILNILMGIPEYKEAAKICAGPRIILGNPKRNAGRVFVEMTGGTEGPKEAYDKLYKARIRTLICMHLSEEHFKKVKDVNLNVVIAGHIASDTLGLNLLLDRIEKKAKEKFQTISFSGFNRISRN